MLFAQKSYIILKLDIQQPIVQLLKQNLPILHKQNPPLEKLSANCEPVIRRRKHFY